MPFSHLDIQGNPSMVDVSEKAVSHRTAIAQATVLLPPAVLEHFNQQDIITPKGSVFQIAIIAGTMAAKRTTDIIPLCHPLGLDSCKFDIRLVNNQVIVCCTCAVVAKTGIEMEALTGASVAALTIYDMCKCFSHEIVIQEIKLLSKTGGKQSFGDKTVACAEKE